MQQENSWTKIAEINWIFWGLKYTWIHIIPFIFQIVLENTWRPPSKNLTEPLGLFIDSVEPKLYVNLVFTQFYLIDRKESIIAMYVSTTFLCEDSRLDLSTPES